MTTSTSTSTSRFSIIRCDRSGVFFGKIGELGGPDGKTAEISEVRNLHYWDGAASVLQLAAEGVKCPSQCRFTMAVPRITVTDVIQVIPCTKEAEDSIRSVNEWKR